MLLRRCCRSVETALQTCFAPRVEFAVLGPVEVRIDGRALSLGGPKQRALLALLLLSRNEVVSRDRLIDSLWGERAPTSAQRSLDTYVSRLRGLVGSDRIERHPPGYLLRVAPGEFDVDEFEALLEQGRGAAAAGDPAAAKEQLSAALDLWRGRALADLESEPFAAEESERLEERRLLALEARIDAELELGAGAELVGELERLVNEHPFRERLLGQLMLSLYRAGRQTEALAAYQSHRRRLSSELGLEPSSQLRALERRILEHDSSLGAHRASRSFAPPPWLKRRRIVAAALALAAVTASVIAGVKLGTGGSRASSALGSRAGIFELGKGSSVGGSSLASAPAAMAEDARTIWLAEPDAGRVVRVDRASRRVVEKVFVGGTPGAVAVGAGAAWVASIPGASVDRIDLATYAVTTPIRLRGARAWALAFGFGHLWVADATHETLLEFDPLAGTLQRRFRLDLHPTTVAIGAGSIWIADYDQGLLERIDPRSGVSLPIRGVGDGPTAIAVGDGAVWVANSLDSTVSKVDPQSDTVVRTIPVGNHPLALASNGGTVFVANESPSTVLRIDAGSGRPVGSIQVGGGPTTLIAAGGRVWVGTRSLATHRGGTLVLLHTRRLSLDPARQGDLPPLQSNGFTYDALLTYAHAGGPQALHLIPDLALRVPVPSNHGTTYTFRLRPGIRYSDGRPVRASDFRRAIERLFRVQSGYLGNYTNIVGASLCTRKRCNLARGLVTDDRAGTIVFRLHAPDPGFRSSLTAIASAPVPPGTPFHALDKTAIPGTGPYIVASANKHEIRYIRNPKFSEWSHAAQPDGNPDEIVMRYGLTQSQEAREVEAGAADWTADGIPASLQPEVLTRFTAQLHKLPIAETDFFRLNTKQAPFNDLRVRQALNLAIDRTAIVRMYGPAVSFPTCQVLPPSFLGYRRYCPYTRVPRADGRWTAPDLARARRLVAASGTRGERITVWGDKTFHPTGTRVVRYTVHLLRRLGYRARARIVAPSVWERHPQVFRKMQLISSGWANGSTFEFVNDALACAAPNNTHFFCDHRLDRAFHQANMLEATDPRAAASQWARIDRELVNQAAWVPLVNIRWVDFVSARVRNYEADPTIGIIADQVWLR
jgi:YVTN family beta-propeller protein